MKLYRRMFIADFPHLRIDYEYRGSGYPIPIIDGRPFDMPWRHIYKHFAAERDAREQQYQQTDADTGKE